MSISNAVSTGVNVEPTSSFLRRVLSRGLKNAGEYFLNLSPTQQQAFVDAVREANFQKGAALAAA